MKKKKNTNNEKHKLNGINIPGKTKELSWIDATDHTGINIKDIERKPISEYLTKRKAVGKVVKENDDGIIIVKDMDENGECDMTAIPKKWLK